MNWSFRVVAIPWAAALFLVAGSGAQQPAKAETPAGAASTDADKPAASEQAASAAASGGKPAASRDISDTLLGDERFSTLSQAMRTAGLMPLLKSKGPFTLFAPTEEAWKKLPSDSRQELLAQPGRLKGVLSLHILKGRVDNVGLHKLRNALTMGGIVIIDYTSGVKINGGIVTNADILCRNGIVHAIDKVLMPVQRSGPRAASGKPAARKTAAVSLSSAKASAP